MHQSFRVGSLLSGHARYTSNLLYKHTAITCRNGKFCTSLFLGNVLSSLPDNDTSPGERRARFLALTDALKHAVWRADSLGHAVSAARTTGYRDLDAELPGGGWAPCALTELLWAQQGGGEFRLLAPALIAVSQAGKTIVLLGSPHDLIAPGLSQAGIDVGQIMIVNADKPGDRLWSAEQILKSGCVGALISWHPVAKTEHLRRLQVAAAGSDSLAFICRPASARHEPSPAPLRLLCAPAPFGQLSVEVIKRRGPLAAAPVLLPPAFAPSMNRALDRVQRGVVLPSENTHVDRVLPSPVAGRPGVPALA